MSPSKAERDFERLLDYLKRNRGFDFTGYKRPSLARRVEKRMESVGIETFGEYIDFLEVHPEEFPALFNTILINVTQFFRDETSWSYLAEHVIPELLARRPHGEIRVWSAGCASGEEAFTILMMLGEAMGLEQLKLRAKIYATDVDDEALLKGRHATYSEREVADVPEKLRAKYFEQLDGHYIVRKDLRRQVIFGRHDLISDAPISRVDLLVCRNTLMYLNAETQAKILARFHFALADGGILFLGRAETLLTNAGTFLPIDLKRRISTKVARGDLNIRDRLLLIAQNPVEEEPAGSMQEFRLREVAADTAPVAQVVIDANGMVVLANDRARAFFGLTPAEVGRPLQDLTVSYRPAELRSLVERSRSERRTVRVRDVEWQPPAGSVQWFDIHVTALFDAGLYVGASVTFMDESIARRLQRELDVTREELSSAYEELQSTNEELETTNEELQSTVEELETTNEELQSTNEELETMNEELQSTNEELSAMNDELRDRSDDLNRAKGFLEAILSSMRGGVAVLDSNLDVLMWNRHAHNLWGLLEEEVAGKNFLALDIGLPVGALKQSLRAVLAGGEPITIDLDATNRRARSIRCQVSITPLQSGMGAAQGVILVMQEVADQGAMSAAN